MPTRSNRSNAVIFDLDGVLVDSEPLHVEAWRRLFALRGITVSDEEYAAGIGVADMDWLRWLFGHRGQPAAGLSWWREAKRATFQEILARDVRAFPGVCGLVRRLYPEFRLGVASNSWRQNIETVLSALGLRACFDALVGVDDVEQRKPHPEAYLRAASRLGVAPVACTVLEDSPAGVQAAKAAGMRCIAITNTLPAERLADADLTLASLENAETIVEFARGTGAP